MRPGAALAALAALVCVLLTAAPARAARAWQAPVDISVSGEAVAGARVAVDAQGSAVAVWVVGRTSGTGGGLSLGVVRGAVRPAGAVWQTPVDISERDAGGASGADVAIDAQGNAVAVWNRFGKVQSAVRPAGGGWQAPVDISGPGEATFASGAQVAVDSQGNAVAVWSGFNTIAGVVQNTVQSAARPAGGIWQAAVDISSPAPAGQVAHVAVDPQGNAVAVWNQVNSGGPPVPVQSAVRPAGGAWQAPVDIPLVAAGGLRPGAPRVVVDSQGDAVAVWPRSDFTHGVAQGAVRPVGGSWQPVDISPEGASVGPVDVAIDGQGNAISIWARSNATAGVVQSAVRPTGGVWQAPVDVSSAGQTARGADVAVDPQGNAVAVWERSNTRGGVVQSAVRPTGGVWQAPVEVSSAGQTAGGAHVAVDADGNAVAVWVAFDGINSIVQSAAYDASGPPPTPPRPPMGAAVARLRLSPSTFRAARSGPTVRPATARTATRVTYTLSAPASIRFTAERVSAGRRVAGRCRKQTRSNRRRKSCTRSMRVRGSFTRRRPAGRDRFRFTGRLAGRALKSGTYRLVATPIDNGRTGRPTRARFRIAR